MKKTNRKGFTIVELVIVIAVIAILAGVLMPTFASVVKKATIAYDTSLVKNRNTALAAYRPYCKKQNCVLYYMRTRATMLTSWIDLRKNIRTKLT